jgi:hypothetical protein
MSKSRVSIRARLSLRFQSNGRTHVNGRYEESAFFKEFGAFDGESSLVRCVRRRGSQVGVRGRLRKAGGSLEEDVSGGLVERLRRWDETSLRVGVAIRVGVGSRGKEERRKQVGCRFRPFQSY